MLFVVVAAGLVAASRGASTRKQTTPNIITILVDDLGYQDVGWRENTDLKDATPFVTQLAKEGIKLEAHYVQPVCTPTRGSLLTGRYATRLGFQTGVINMKTQDALPLSERTLAEEMQAAGYRTALMGKWHLGNSLWAHVPNQRGFDEYRGYYGGTLDFWTKLNSKYLDIHVNNEGDSDPASISSDTYSQYVWQQGVDAFLRGHAVNHPGQPFYMFYAMQTVHSPMQAPDSLLAHPACSAISDKNRKIYCAMILVTDNMIQNTFKVLGDLAYDDNTLVLFSADNGGAPASGGYNMPLRGSKSTYFEGGVRAAAFLWGPMLPAAVQGTTYTGMLHLADWLPTLMHVATDGKWTPDSLPNPIDGHDAWDAITTGRASPRTELLHNYAASGTSALRMGEYKIITGQKDAEWTPVPDSLWVAMANSSRALSATVRNCNCAGNRCNYLFHIASDPTETTNLCTSEPERYAQMLARLEVVGAPAEAACNTCGDVDAAATEAAAKTGYWLPWRGTPPGAPAEV